MPLVGDRQPLDALAAEYEAGSQVFVTKIHTLEQQYIAVRRTRGDGNCFFRSFLFAYLEPMAAGRNAATRQQYVYCLCRIVGVGLWVHMWWIENVIESEQVPIHSQPRTPSHTHPTSPIPHHPSPITHPTV